MKYIEAWMVTAGLGLVVVALGWLLKDVPSQCDPTLSAGAIIFIAVVSVIAKGIQKLAERNGF